MHFSLLSIASASTAIPATALLFFDCPAGGTTPGLIGEALGSEELLLGSAKGEACVAIRASEGFVCICHG
jgi:hypothetical protein